MMKRLTALALAMLLVLTASTAFAWACPNCGAAMETNFCTECGAKKPENICPGCGFNHGEKALKFCTECGTRMDGAAAVETPAPAAQGPAISQVFENENGTVSILWDADGVTEYTIECIQRRSDDPLADRAADNGFYVSQGKADIGFDTIVRLIPGERYWFGVFDENGEGQYTAFEPVRQPGVFSDFPLTLEGELLIERDGAQLAEPITAEEIISGAKVGLYLAAHYENPGDKLESVAQIVIEAANGARWVVAGYLDLRRTTRALQAGSSLT